MIIASWLRFGVRAVYECQYRYMEAFIVELLRTGRTAAPRIALLGKFPAVAQPLASSNV